jgi:hypothetical protein
MRMQVVRRNAMSAIVNITRNACAAVVSLIRTLLVDRMIDVTATHRRRQKAVVTDSESWFLAIKKFSCITASRLIAARQTRFFAGIAAADSYRDFVRATRRGWLMRAGAGPTRSSRHHAARRSDAEFGLEQIVHGLRIGLAAG